MRQILDWEDIFAEALCCLGYVWAADQFCGKFLEISKKNEKLFLAASVCGYLLMEAANRFWQIPHIVLMTLSHICFAGLVMALFQGDKEKKFLAVSLLMTVRALMENFCESILSCLVLIFHHTVACIQLSFLSEREGNLIACVSLLAVVLTISWTSRILVPVFCGKTRKWYVVLAVPLVAITVVIDVAVWGASNGIMVRSGGNMGLYYDQIFSHVEFCVLALLCMFAAGFYVFGMERIYLEQEKSSQYHMQITVYKMLEEQYRQSERLRHDMKNHIFALSGLFQGKEWDKLGEYLKTMEGQVWENGGETTGSRAVDALLYQKRKQAEEKKILWECDIQLPKACRIHEFDFCVLIGNILDNALEACDRLSCDRAGRKGHSFINIQGRTVKRCFLLEVRNSMSETETYGGGSAKKENPREHGIGLLNVGDVVRKYNGVVNIEAKNGMFVISVLIPFDIF